MPRREAAFRGTQAGGSSIWRLLVALGLENTARSDGFGDWGGDAGEGEHREEM
jgi:hypothetical protein